MIELLKKTLWTGIGVAAMSKDKIEEVAKDLVEKGKMTENEGKALVDELLIRSDEAGKELQKRIEKVVQSVLEKMDLAKKSEIDALKADIAKLRQLVETSEEE